MRKVIMLILVVAMIVFTSCKKEDIRPKVEPVKVENCNCGEVVGFGQTITSESDNGVVIQREVEVFNLCTGEITVELTDNLIVQRGFVICN